MLCDSEHLLTRPSGSADVSFRKGQFVLYNMIGGFELYELETRTYLRAFQTEWPIKVIPRRVAFGEDSRVVVAGSDHGIVYVFERRTGKILDKLRHGRNKIVATVAVGPSI